MNLSTILFSLQSSFVPGETDGKSLGNALTLDEDKSDFAQLFSEYTADYWQKSLEQLIGNIKSTIFKRFQDERMTESIVNFITFLVKSMISYFNQKDYTTAFDFMREALKNFFNVDLLKALTDNTTNQQLLSALDILCHSLIRIGVRANKQQMERGYFKEHLKEVIEDLKQYKSKIQSQKSMDHVFKMKIFLILTNKSSWLHHHLTLQDKYTEIKVGLKTLSTLISTAKQNGVTNPWASFSKAEIVTFYYYKGMQFLVDGSYSNAANGLAYSFEKCNKTEKKNSKLILRQFCIAKLLCGNKLPQEILTKYHLGFYKDLYKTMREGSLKKFNNLIDHIKYHWIKIGLYVTIDDLRELLYRRIIKKIFKILGIHFIKLKYIMNAFNLSAGSNEDEEEYNLENTECIVGNLISDQWIIGTIDFEKETGDMYVKLNKNNPFPKIEQVRKTNREFI